MNQGQRDGEDGDAGSRMKVPVNWKSQVDERAKRQAAEPRADEFAPRRPMQNRSQSSLGMLDYGRRWDDGLEDGPAKSRFGKGGGVGTAAKAADQVPAHANSPRLVQRKAATEAEPAAHDGVTAADHRATTEAYAPGPLPRLQLRGTLPAVFIPAKSAGSASGPSPSLDITPPNAGIDKPGFIDNSDGANIRTGPAETGGTTVRDTALPPATRVFVSGTHPSAPAWWYVTAYLPDKAMVRGYVQSHRVNIELPEPLAELRQLVGGETAEGFAKEKFGGAVTDGHDLRYYENVLLHVNHGRAGINGTYQDPGVLGGSSNNIQLVAGHRIWLVSAEYAKALQSVVPSGSLTGGAVAKVKRFAGHFQDILHSVTESRSHGGEIAGGLAQAIRDHLPEIIGITAGFLMAEATSMFLAAAPTGVTQAAAVVIQLALSAFGAAGLVQAGVEAVKHGTVWLTTAWTAHGKPEAIAAASKEFLRMLVAIAMAALSYLGVKGNYGSALKIARAMPTSGLPALATAVSSTTGHAGAGTGVSIGPSTGAIGAAGNVMQRIDDEDPKDVVDYLSGRSTSSRPRFDGDEEHLSHDHRDDVCFPEGYEDLAEQDGYQVTEARDTDDGSAARAPKRPTWQESERRVSHDLDWADFKDQRSFFDKKDVLRGAPGSTRPDSFSERFRMSVDVKNYDISTSQGRSSVVERIVQQVTKRAPHLPNGTRQGIVIDARGQATAEKTLVNLRDQIVRKAGGLVDPDNIVFLTE